MAQAIASATGTAASVPLKTIDLTHSAGATRSAPPADTVAVIAAPVYGGRVAPTAVKRFETPGAKALLLSSSPSTATGHSEKAVAELAGLACGRDSSRWLPGLSSGSIRTAPPKRPSPRTPRYAGPRRGRRRLAPQCAKTAAGNLTPVDAAGLKDVRTPLLPMLRFIRFVLGYRRRQRKKSVVHLPAGNACTPLRRCAAICPTQAIARGDETHTDPARCIRCCACVKGCPVGARSFHTPFAAALARNFARRKPPVTRL